jgi:hypothetical protein
VEGSVETPVDSPLVAEHEAERGSGFAVLELDDFVGQEPGGAPLKEELFRHFVDQDFFIDADGLVFFDQGGVDPLKLAVVFVGQQRIGGRRGRGERRFDERRLCRLECEGRKTFEHSGDWP